MSGWLQQPDIFLPLIRLLYTDKINRQPSITKFPLQIQFMSLNFYLPNKVDVK